MRKEDKTPPSSVRHSVVAVVICSILVAYLAIDPRTPVVRAGDPEEETTETAEAAGQPLLEWFRPRFADRQEERELMVAHQIVARGVDDAGVLDAMRQVPRHLFVPEALRGDAYEDGPLPIGHGQTISQPLIVALMTELLDIRAGERILEIGTGSGYQAAVLSELTPNVYTMEIIRALGEEATDRLSSLGYETVQVKIADGYYGWPEMGPFDGIIVTCAAGHVPPPLLEQLSPEGVMVIPVGGSFEIQYLTRVTKDADGVVHSEMVAPVLFVPMTGRAQLRG